MHLCPKEEQKLENVNSCAIFDPRSFSDISLRNKIALTFGESNLFSGAFLITCKSSMSFEICTFPSFEDNPLENKSSFRKEDRARWLKAPFESNH
jgi:hypothetical protein